MAESAFFFFLSGVSFVGERVSHVSLRRSVVTLIAGSVCRTERSALVPAKIRWRVQARTNVMN